MEQVQVGIYGCYQLLCGGTRFIGTPIVRFGLPFVRREVSKEAPSAPFFHLRIFVLHLTSFSQTTTFLPAHKSSLCLAVCV